MALELRGLFGAHEALRLSSPIELTAVVGRLHIFAMPGPNHPRSSSGGRCARVLKRDDRWRVKGLHGARRPACFVAAIEEVINPEARFL